MSAAEPADQLRPLLRAAVKALEIGHWRWILRPPEFQGHHVAGSKESVDRAIAHRLVARSQQLQAQGRMLDAWARLGEAAALLPPQLVRRDPLTGVALALLRPEPSDDMPLDMKLLIRLARVIWRDQFELQYLRRTFAPEKEMKARDQLIAAFIHHLMWVEGDPATYERPESGRTPWDDGVNVDRTRTALCRRATEIRWFADQAATVEVSQAPWQDGGAFRGLHADALDLLATQTRPAPWCGSHGTSGLVVRRGRLRAWQYARQRKEDLDSFRVLMLV
jgi:hypothetical protein